EVGSPRPDLDPVAFNAWRLGQGSTDPTLVVSLVADPNRPGRFVSRDALHGRLFVRECLPSAPHYRPYADVLAKAGALELATRPDQACGLRTHLAAPGV